MEWLELSPIVLLYLTYRHLRIWSSELGQHGQVKLGKKKILEV